MKNYDNQADQFFAYVMGRMTTEEESAFSDKLQQNPDLEDALQRFRLRHERAAMAEITQEERREEMTAIRHLSKEEQLAYADQTRNERQALATKLREQRQKELAKRIPTNQPRKTMRPVTTAVTDAATVPLFNYRFLSMAAAILLLAVVSFIFLRQFTSNSGMYAEGLAEAAYQERPFTLDAARGETTAAWSTAREEYLNKDYDKVIKTLKGIDQPTAAMTNLMGHAYFLNEEFTLSAQQFDRITSGEFKYEAQWYAALAVLADPEESKAARQRLQTIADNDQHPFRIKAREVLDGLKQ